MTEAPVENNDMLQLGWDNKPWNTGYKWDQSAI